jgi:hypothetical protein
MLQVMESKFISVDKRISEYDENINTALKDLNDKVKNNKRGSQKSAHPPVNPQPMASIPNPRSSSLSGLNWAQPLSPARSRNPLSFTKIVPVVDVQDPSQNLPPSPKPTRFANPTPGTNEPQV